LISVFRFLLSETPDDFCFLLSAFCFSSFRFPLLKKMISAFHFLLSAFD